MGKKVERAPREKLPQAVDESGERTPEPYQCTGHFNNDFTELCRQNNMYRPPPVILRPKRPVSPSQTSANDAGPGGGGKKGRDDKKQQQQQQQLLEEEQDNSEEKEIIETLGFKPKTFGVRDGLEYMKPCVQVEMEHPDKQDTVTEVYIRGWLVENQMMNTFRQCFTVLPKLTSLHFWRAGLTSELITDLSQIVCQCEQLKTLTIEANNPIPEENFYDLIKEDSHLSKLQLRYCGITEKGAALIADQLGSVKSSNLKLLSLDLSGNKIGDAGAIALSKGLRTNRTLLHLSVSNNGIGNSGAKAFAEVLSRFFLSPEEIIERRFLMSEKGSSDRAKSVSPPPSRRGDSKDRPGSVKSTDRDKGKARDKSSKNKKDGKEKDDKGKSKKDDKAAGKKVTMTTSPGAQQGISPRVGRRLSVQFAPTVATDSGETHSTIFFQRSATVGDAGKPAAKAKTKGAKGAKTVPAIEQSEEDSLSDKPSTDGIENLNPLLEKVEFIEPGDLLIQGNFTLIFLNLSRNEISEKGIDELKMAMSYQTTHLRLESKINGTGLMKLILKGNKFTEDYVVYKKLEEIMLPRDPFYKPPPKTPDTESHHS